MLKSVIALFLGAAFVGQALAEDFPVLPMSMDEHYGETVKVSGWGLLVGVMAGAAPENLVAGAVDFEGLRIPTGPLSRPTSVCLFAKSRDGQYWASGTTRVTGARPATDLVRVQPEPGWQYQDATRQYRWEAMAVVARVGDDCGAEGKADYYPVVIGNDLTRLSVYLNAPRAMGATVAMVDAAGGRTEGSCVVPAADLRVEGFNFRCDFQVAAGSLRHDSQLELRLRDRSGPRLEKFTIRGLASEGGRN